MRTNADLIVAAAESLDPSKISTADGMTPLYNGARLDSYSPLYADAGIPGVLFRTSIADEGGNIDTDLNAAFLAQLDSLWSHRLAAAGFFSDAQVARARSLIAVGVVVIPSNTTTIKNIDPAHPVGMFEPAGLDSTPGRRAQWDAVVKQFRDIVTAYLKGEQADARAKGAALEADTAFWDSVYAAVKDLPANVAGWTSQQILHAFLGIATNPYVLGLGALAVVGFIVYRKGSVAIVKAAAG